MRKEQPIWKTTPLLHPPCWALNAELRLRDLLFGRVQTIKHTFNSFSSVWYIWSWNQQPVSLSQHQDKTHRGARATARVPHFCARGRRVSMALLGGAESAYCCSCPWLCSGSQRGSGYVHDAAIVTPDWLKYNLLGPFALQRIRADRKVSVLVHFQDLFYLHTLALALENYCWQSIPVLHHEQARKQTNMDAVRYSSATADAGTEIMLLASYSV